MTWGALPAPRPNWGALIADYLCRGEGCEKCPNELVCDAMIQTIILLGKLRLRKVI